MNDRNANEGGDGGDHDTDTTIRPSKRRRPPIQCSKNRFSPPTSIEIRGVPIHFPFQPYPCQISYMTSVMQALQQSENALLESPTGTGKTLCLLCACLAYQQQHKETRSSTTAMTVSAKSSSMDHDDSVSTVATSTTGTSTSTSRTTNTTKPPFPHHTNTTTNSATTTIQKNNKCTIIYASRTHSQLSQVVRELRNTRYRPQHAVLGSREQLCIHPKVNPASNQNHNHTTSTTNKTTNAHASSTTHNQQSSHKITTAYDINQNCNRLGKERKCRFRNQLEGFTAPSNDPSLQEKQQPVRDMEELIALGKDHQICPFYYTRALVDPNVEIVFVPYNYLFDKDARDTTLAQIHWENAILIFDEAHNLEAFASDSASFDLTHIHIAGCITEITKTIQYIQTMGMSSSSNNIGGSGSNLKLDNLIKLKSIFLKLEQYIMNLGLQTAYQGEFMMDIFQKGCGITFANHEVFIDEVRKVNDFLMDLRGGSGSSSNTSTGAPKLEHFIQCIKRVYGYGNESRCIAKAAFYRVHVSPKTTMAATSSAVTAGRGSGGGGKGVGGPTTGRTVSYWCFAPSLAMEELASLNVRSILVTSGTLSPLPSYSMELGLPFPHLLENPHIISSNQVHVRVIGKGVSGKLLNSSYERRQNNEYYIELGNTLITLAKVVPEGMLVFFPSYSVMESCIEAWGGPASSRSNYNNNNNSNQSKGNDFFAKKRKPVQQASFSFPLVPTHFATDRGVQQASPWKRLLAAKSVVIEPKASTDLSEALADFKRYLAMPKSPGCVLMGVCRGKISEGIDFADEQSRAVVITGLPFPPSHDTKVKMKREYLDNIRVQSSKKASENGGFAVNKSNTRLNDKLSGNEWYTQQAHRAVNQAIGRVIRNRNDYGAVLLLDSRFDQPQNQQGLSKWLRPHINKDEGFGIAIRSLVDFYKTATYYTEQKKLEEKKAVDAPRPILEYEDDFGHAVDEPPNKIALVRRSASSENDGVNGSDSKPVAYVDPNDVIARLDVNDVLRPRVPNNVQNDGATLKAPPALYSRDDLFDTKMPPPVAVTTETKSKSLAEECMLKMTQKLSSSDLSKVRKQIVAMKNAGEKNDEKLFLESVRAIVQLIIVSESLGEKRLDFESSMLYMFFSLLPKQKRSLVEVISFELVYQNSTLFKLLQASSDENKGMSILTFMGMLLQKLWSRKPNHVLPIELYLRESNMILVSIRSNQELQAYLNLIPERYHVMTQTWLNEMIASKNIQRMKEKDRKNVGDASVDSNRFRNHNVNITNQQMTHKVTAAASITLHRKIEEPFVPKRQKGPSNPYAKRPPSQPMTKSVKTILESTEIDVYVKPNTSNAVKNIKTNAPKNLTCAICSETCREPFIAECGHMACLSCWLGWLNRSPTCMTCRVATQKESLARVVYERKAGGGNAIPTLTQLCQEDDSDDELEICDTST